jgi:hypothetical protein
VIDDKDDVIARLEARLRTIEDRMEIYQLMSTYGPCADSGSGDVVEKLYTTDGKYDSGFIVCEGAAGVREMLETMPLHRSLMADGCAHIIDMPFLKIDGDTAIAFCHSQLLRHQGDETYVIFRTSATFWHFDRTPDGWKIAKRVNRPLNGSEDGQQLFRDALLEHAV